MLQLRIQGRGGQGAQLAGEILATAYFREGKYVQAYSTYGGARRGTPVSTFIRVDSAPIRERCDIEEPDAIVCFDPSLLSPALLGGARPDTVVLVNSNRAPSSFCDLGDYRFATLDALAVAQKNDLGRIVNSAVLGAFARVIGSPGIEHLANVVRDVSPRKSEENAGATMDGYRLVRILGKPDPEGLEALAGITPGSATEGGRGMSRPPNEIPTIWTTGFTDVFNTGTWRAATPVYAWRPSPCLVDCPIDNAIPRWIKYISEGDYQQAWLELVETNPFPAVTGRVCHHPCEGHCNREVLEAVVGINGLEHFLGDHALDHGWALPEAAEPVGKRVAVVGGGPAGLSCAYHLRRLGYQVTIFEARERLGGLLRHGIPEYRLAAQVADREIQRVVDLGVEVRTSTSVGDSQAFAQLREEYDAVFVAVGAQQAKRLPHLDAGAGAGRVLDGLDYLRRCIEGATRGLGERMTVIGGGSAAVDVARTARRLGHRVSMVALETRAVMPAQREEVEEALEEGVALFDGAMVTRVEATAGGLRLDCVKVQLDPTAPAGELRPLPVDGGGFVLEADVIVTAIGQDPNLTAFGGDIRVDAGVAAAAPDTAATTAAGVFAGGDAAGTSRFVSVAIGDGRRAAYGIAAYLGHPDAEVVVRHTLEQAVNRNEVNVFYFDFAERNEKAKAPVAERLTGFAEVNRVFTPEQAAAEAARCLTCGTCIECDNCFVFCPDMAVKKDDSKSDSPEGRYVILDQYCKGCGLCVAECPRGAVHLEQVTQ